MRNFAGMSGWYFEINGMHMLDWASSEKVSGVRGFRFSDGALQEQLTYRSDQEHAFRYEINVSPDLWMNYHSGARMYSVTASDGCFAVWAADWTVSANNNTRLISMVHHEVFQRAFDTLDNMLHVA